MHSVYLPCAIVRVLTCACACLRASVCMWVCVCVHVRVCMCAYVLVQFFYISWAAADNSRVIRLLPSCDFGHSGSPLLPWRSHYPRQWRPSRTMNMCVIVYTRVYYTLIQSRQCWHPVEWFQVQLIWDIPWMSSAATEGWLFPRVQMIRNTCLVIQLQWDPAGILK